jgi:hypothetical protein
MHGSSVTFHVLVDGEGGIDMPLDHMGIISTHAWDIIFCSFKVVVAMASFNSQNSLYFC